LASNQPDAFATWVAGIFYDHRTQTDFQVTYSSTAGPTGANVFDAYQRVTDDQLAGFAQGDLHFTKKLTATVGLRVADAKTNLFESNGSGIFNGGEPPTTYANLKETPSTPKVALSYQADTDNLIYTSVGKGFRVGGGNAPVADYCNSSAPSTFKSDYVWSYEIGAKDTLFDGRVQLDSSVFHIDWRKIQQLVLLQCGLEYTANAGGAVSNGFDLALQAILTRHLRANLNVGYVNAYFTSNVFNTSGNPLVVSGDKIGLLPQVNPPWDVDAALTYEFPLPGGEIIHLRGEYRYHSSNAGPFTTQITTSPSYFPGIVANPATQMVNARIGITIQKVDVTLLMDNVFNSHPLLDAYQDTSTSNLITYGTFRPRTIGLAANVGF
jgi:outer membrane receptor protein involved in Fe transport